MINKFILPNIIIIIFVFWSSCNCFLAQNYQITYEVKFKPVQESDSFIKENMVLKIANDQSIFYNLNKNKIDSLVSKYNFKAISSINSSLLRIKVFKNFSKDYNTVGGNFNQFNYWYKEKKIKYYNLKKYGKYKDYAASEAFTDFGKRKWHLIYTNDIPINDGPYIFSGLPGLIIKAESLDGDYTFELIEIKKLEEKSLLAENKENIKKEKLIKSINDFINDPASHKINFQNDKGDSFNYEFGGVKDKNYHDTNENIKNIIQKFNNYPDKDIPIITF